MFILKLLFYAFLIYIVTKVYKIYKLITLVKKEYKNDFSEHQNFENNTFGSQQNKPNKDIHGGDYVDYEEVK